MSFIDVHIHSVWDKVRKYIANQEDHHRVRTFQEEVDDLFKHSGMKSTG